ncbi:Transposon Tf2-11 polyprotein, partial [Dictyocoela roeselum]
MNTKLAYPDPNSDFSLETDASENAMGSVLSQNKKPIGFYSYKFNESEKNYTVAEKELFAIIMSLLYFKPIIFTNRIIIHTDNKNLIPDKSISNRIQRWKLLIEEFNYEIKHIDGNKNVVADALSRINLMKADELIKIDCEIIERLQKEDKKLDEYVKEGKYIVNENKLISDKRKRIVIPDNYKNEFFKKVHSRLLHPGTRRTYLTVRNYLCCTRLKKTISKIVEQCEVCMRTKNTSKIYGV